MKQLFDDISLKTSKIVTKNYSTSFSLGILFLDKNIRGHIYSIYGFVRLADEIVDSFESYDQEYLLGQFEYDLHNAFVNKISLNPILNSFQKTYNEFNIGKDLTDKFMASMAMDLDKKEYNKSSYEEYILGSAEVVGLMCLKVFLDGDNEKYEELKPYAMRLGAAFQKINFLRDLKADYEDLGRSYFPNLDIENFDAKQKNIIEDEIEEDFKVALMGIKKLPKSSRQGVYLAYLYYQKLFLKIKRTPAQKILLERIRIPNLKKIVLMLQSFVRYQTNLL
ncbi:MAG: phytoene synthase [Flavobacteriales bacterium]|jgi:phytoene synthase|tara:strand:+ start:1757 stop:2593 length:837 start_codon:yes stop_codon:yes gene_type:complete